MIDRNDHGAHLWNREELLDMRMRIERQCRHMIARLHAQMLQRCRTTVTTLEKLLVGENLIAINDRFAISVQASCSPRIRQRRQGWLHGLSFGQRIICEFAAALT